MEDSLFFGQDFNRLNLLHIWLGVHLNRAYTTQKLSRSNFVSSKKISLSHIKLQLTKVNTVQEHYKIWNL